MSRMTLIRRLTAIALVLGAFGLATRASAAGAAQPQASPAPASSSHAGPVELLRSWLDWLQRELAGAPGASARSHRGAGVTGGGGCIDPNGGACNPGG
jgi:hypothetical protein